MDEYLTQNGELNLPAVGVLLAELARVADVRFMHNGGHAGPKRKSRSAQRRERKRQRLQALKTGGKVLSASQSYELNQQSSVVRVDLQAKLSFTEFV